MLNTEQLKIFSDAVNIMAADAPVLYGANGQALRQSTPLSIRRESGKNSGALKNWNPRQHYSTSDEARDRDNVVKRSMDLTVNDAQVAGLQDAMATSIIGPQLYPYPTINGELIGKTKEESKKLEAQARRIYDKWALHASADGRLNAGMLQFLQMRNLFEFGEFVFLLPMITDEPDRPYNLAIQPVHPTRVSSPTDAAENVRDGVQLGKFGRPEAYFIKKAGRSAYTGQNDFIKIMAKKGHRWNAIHGFDDREGEAVRGWPIITPAVGALKNYSDLLNAELVSGIVSAALSLFLKTQPPSAMQQAQMMAQSSESVFGKAGAQYTERYQELTPGQIMYGAEEPKLLSPNRPGNTFEPFTRLIKKSIAQSIGLPYAAAFRDVENVNFAGFRSAMLEAWKTYSWWRSKCAFYWQRIRVMVLEEAYLRGEFEVNDFYENQDIYCSATYVGPPKGDIEPVKDATKNEKLIKMRLKTRRNAIIEGGGDPDRTFPQIEEEEKELTERGLNEVNTINTGSAVGDSSGKNTRN